jgi:Zn-dependent alcohol dehydrogenase
LLAVHPAGFDAVIECVGRVEAMTLAPRLLSKGGAVVLVGAPPEGLTFPLQALDMVLGQKRVLGCLRGDVRPHVDFDVVFGLYRAGQLHLDELVTSTLPLDRADEAFARAGAGEGIRTVIVPQPPTG